MFNLSTKPDYNVPDEPAKFWIDDRLIPVTPHTLSIKQNPKNESGALFDGRPITRTKLMDAQTITIEFMLPFYEELNVCFPDTWYERKYFTDEFWYKEEERAYYIVSITYPNGEFFNFIGMLDSWDYTQSGEKGSDWAFTLTFTEAAARENVESQYTLENPYVRVGARDYTRLN